MIRLLNQLIGECQRTNIKTARIPVNDKLTEENKLAELKKNGYLVGYANIQLKDGNYWMCSLTQKAFDDTLGYREITTNYRTMQTGEATEIKEKHNTPVSTDTARGYFANMRQLAIPDMVSAGNRFALQAEYARKTTESMATCNENHAKVTITPDLPKRAPLGVWVQMMTLTIEGDYNDPVFRAFYDACYQRVQQTSQRFSHWFL